MKSVFFIGKFLYVDGTNGTTGTAVLESQLLTPEQHSDFCFSFWFFIDVSRSYPSIRLLR